MQQHKTNMIHEEWNNTQNDAPFVAFYDIRTITFVLPDEMADASIAGLQWFIIIPRLNHTGLIGQLILILNTIYIEKKNIGFGTRTTQPAAILRSARKAAVCLRF